MSKQIVMVSLEELVVQDHVYRKFKTLWNFDCVKKQRKKIEKDNNYKGMEHYGYLNVYYYNLWKI